ncbi:Na(+)/H(+) exchange regulatory cofactor NHE-RF3 [Bufo gargarizans]|uniref:Na(+)/H(+) exchange regulatory cofactor NHE-RF3 n=1 Tax=Bufo gargarizans TaxID=30331 RepID=UPI001CF132B7|nr:Na(+)/H(+) exchange regulatory cofactor NHE-RF3 [Bufo gargarizans]XP_044143376.1 Na(+)/H(+) exchange regulatory cofactor NHE-RF3 [Bufo gargarizans]
MDLNAKARECSITKQDGKGYGFFLRIEKDVLGHLIRSVESGSSADKAGLKDGDRVLKVNGVNVDDTEHTKVVEMIQASGTSVTLTVLDEVSYLNSKKNQENLSENKAPPGEAVSPKPRLCYLVKDKGSFGFSLKTQKGTKGFYLDALAADGVAVKAGVKQGDRIIELNGKNVEFLSYDDLVKQVKESGDSVMFLVADKETNDYYHKEKKKITAHEATPHLLPNPPRTVDLEKAADGYGFFLRQEKNRKGHLIVDIDQKSSAYKAGLKDYDRIVAVNGESVESFEHEQVVEAIQKGNNKTSLLISNKVTDEIYAKAGISPFLYLKASKAQKPTETQPVKPSPAPEAKPTEAQPAKPTTTQPAATISSLDPKHKPRLCKLTKGSSGFGFNLNAIKDVPGQFIKQVNKGGPADVAGIKEDDFLVEVNGVNVEKEGYENVVMKIKEAGGSITVLVVSQEGYEHFKAQKIQITSSMADPLPESKSPPASSDQKNSPNKTELVSETKSPPPVSSDQKNPPNKAEPVSETKSPPPVSSDQKNPPNKAEPVPETKSPPPVSSDQKNPPNKTEPVSETKSPPPVNSDQKTPPNKTEPVSETKSPTANSDQKTPPSKARSVPEPVEKETKTPAEKPPKDDDDTAL